MRVRAAMLKKWEIIQMRKIQYKRLDTDCFNAHSLDSFVRHQTVTECWRKVDRYIYYTFFLEKITTPINERSCAINTRTIIISSVPLSVVI